MSSTECQLRHMAADSREKRHQLTLTCSCCSRICSAVTDGGSGWRMLSSSLSRPADSSSLASWKSEVSGTACSSTHSLSALSLAQLLLCRCKSSILSCRTGSLSSVDMSRLSRLIVDSTSRALLRWLVMSSCSVCHTQISSITSHKLHKPQINQHLTCPFNSW